MTRTEIENLGYVNLGSGWFSNDNDTMRIRLWKDDELDIYKWRSDDDNQVVFRGTLTTLKDFEWVLKVITL